ncbi:RHS repeat-associated core domain-containing protein [Pyxidicoccus caerfyrddinensis]|uniref:RHS repeat-associated core domain-containing protein n=1 Tax=Pyxidicoccus caerfyrddinensis TaxID=2709663 RepID=UPI0013DB7045|nr:RHS repeat-associated core domain-containing protein [Pyxidicoccus caerfyrddinensis]
MIRHVAVVGMLFVALAGCGRSPEPGSAGVAPVGQQRAAVVTTDVTPPAITFGTAQDAVLAPPVTLTWSISDENDTTYDAWLDGVPVRSGVQVSQQGRHVLVVQATDAVGLTSLATLRFFADTAPPVVIVSGVIDGQVENAASFTPVISASDYNGVILAMTLNGQPYTSGTPVTAEGLYTLYIQATDGAGRVTTRVVGFVLDRTPPAFSIGDKPWDYATNVPFFATWSTSDLTSTQTEAWLDGVPVGPGPFVQDEGWHTLTLQATDAVGLTTTRVWRIFIDTQPPVITVSGVQDGDVLDVASVAPGFTATDNDLALYPPGVTATLDDDAFSGGTPLVDEKDYVLRVTATDRAGNVATHPDVRFAIDRTAPRFEVTGLELLRSRTPYVIVYSIVEPHLETWTARVDGVDYVSGTAVAAPGTHLFRLEARDKAGHVSLLERAFTLDQTAPSLVVTGVPSLTRAETVTPVFSATDDGPGPITFAGRLDGTTEVLSGEPVAVSVGAHELVVTATDDVGNEAREVIAFTVDRTPPEISISGATAGQVRGGSFTLSYTVQDEHPGPPASAKLGTQDFVSGSTVSDEGAYTLVVTALDGAGNEAQASVSFTVDLTAPVVERVSPEDDVHVKAESVEVVLEVTDNLSQVTVRSGATTFERGADGKHRATFPLVEGANVIDVEVMDQADHVTSHRVTVFRDMTAPELVVAEPEEGERIREAQVTVSGTAADLSPPVTVTVGSTSVQADSLGNYSLTAPLVPGANTLTVTATDALGNSVSVARGVRSNIVLPTLSVSTPSDGATVTTEQVTVSGTAAPGGDNDPENAVIVSIGETAVPLDGQAFTANIPLDLGLNTLTITATDRYGLVRTQTRTVTRAEPPPDAGSPDAGTADAGTADAGTADAGAPRDAGTADAGAPRDAGTGGGTSDAGPVASVDAGSGTPESSPVLVVELPEEQGVFGGNHVVVSGRVEGGKLPLRVTVAGVNVPTLGRDFTGSLVLNGDGEHRLQLQVTDALGRTATAQRTVVMDRTAPILTITDPSSSPAVVFASPYRIRGTVGEPHLVSLTINGEPVQPLAGQFSHAVELAKGEGAQTSVSIVARDVVGHVTERTLVLQAQATWPVVRIISPVEGSEAPGADIPVVVEVDSLRTVTVRVGTGQATRIGETNRYEVAHYGLDLGDNTIVAVATDDTGMSSSASVRVRYRDALKEPLAVTGVVPRPGEQDVEPDALISLAFNKPIRVEDLDARIKVKAEGQSEPLAGGFSVAPGAQTVTFIARAPLPEGTRLRVEVSGLQAAGSPDAGSVGMTAPFSSDFSVRRPLTRVRGIVTDADFRPLSGVSVTLEALGLSTVTGPDGNWALFAPHGGQMVVRYEGGITSDGRTLPTVRRRLVVTEGGDTQDLPLPLTPVDLTSAQLVDALSTSTLDFSGRHPGLSVELTEAGGLSFADGRTHGVVTATEVPSYALPVPMEGRAALAALWQVGPAGLRLDKSATLRMPNLTGLPLGHHALLLAYDAHAHVLERVGFGRVVPGGPGQTLIVSTQPLVMRSVEFLGYMPLTDAQNEAVAAALGTGGGSPTDGGLGLRTPPGSRGPAIPAWKHLLSAFTIGEAHAQLGGTFYGGYSALDTMLNNSVPAALMGSVRAPLERQLALQLRQPAETDFGAAASKLVALPYTLALDFSARFESADPFDQQNPERVRLVMEAKGPGGEVLTPPEGESWTTEEQEGEAALAPNVRLPLGTSELTLTAYSRSSHRVLKLEAELKLEADGGTPDAGPSTGDGGAGEDGGTSQPDAGVPVRLTLRKTVDTFNEADDEAVHSPVRFRGLRVSVTGPGSGYAAVTGDTGGYGMPIVSLGGESMGIACTEVPTGPRLVERVGADGVVHYEPTLNQFPVCSQTFWVYPGRSTRADILVDVRMLHGSLTFMGRDGGALEGTCVGSEEPAEVDPKTGDYVRIAAEDVKKTEVHFFREDDLVHPIATFTTGKPNEPAECAQGGVFEQGLPHGYYARVRTGPAANIRRMARERCRELEKTLATDAGLGDGGSDDPDWVYYQANCQDNRTNYLRLNPGERLVVFAVNHATGYAGMRTITVPALNRVQRREDGTCPLDEASGPLKVDEYGETLTLSRCTQTELGIPADLSLYPPELDVRVSRRTTPEGVLVAPTPSLIRHGGAATTRDDFLQVSTHWRVRQTLESDLDAGTDGGSDAGTDAGVDAGPPRLDAGLPDGGFDVDFWCQDAGTLPDGGACAPGAIRDWGTPGQALEVFCSELPEGSAQRVLGQCAAGSARVVDVPAGVPPLAGRIVRVTGTSVEEPAVVSFAVRPGRHTATVQAALTYENDAGQPVVVGALPRANYYLHVVGHPVLDRDENDDGFLQPSEQSSKPPDFADGVLRPEDPVVSGLPRFAVGLKNVYRSREADGTALERYDLAREHEFRVLQMGPATVTAHTGTDLPDAGLPGRVLTDEARPSASEDDLAYDFLMQQYEEPDEPGRAGTLSGEYTLRLGTDDFGIECPVKVDEANKQISGTCAGEYLPEVLSAGDILYFELYLSGNADNVLYRFNFHGISPRTDYVTAGGTDTVEKSLASAPAPTSLAAADSNRPISEKAVAYFAVEPEHLTKGWIEICETTQCTDQTRLKRARLDVEEVTARDPKDPSKLIKRLAFKVTEESGRAGALYQFDKPGANNARRFAMTLPNDVGTMMGADRRANVLVLKTQQDALFSWMTPPPPRTSELGEPVGRYTFVNARAVGQTKVDGINLAGGHLALSYEDFSIPQFGEQVRFVRTYNNQSNVIGPTGTGWMHEYEGFVFEEELGRYTVVLGGQSYDFPGCATIERDTRTASECHTDKSHGGKLRIGVKEGGAPDVEFTSQEGVRYQFNRLSKISADEGRRRWVLTRYASGQEMPEDPQKPDKGWTLISHVGDTDRVERVQREPGLLTLVFTYKPILPKRDVLGNAQPSLYADRLKLKARTEELELLSEVGVYFRHQVPGDLANLDTSDALHRVRFTHDAQGNLVRAERPTGLPRQAWVYEYAKLPEGVSGYARWRIANELRTVRYQLTKHPFPEPDEDDALEFFDQWVTTYASSGASKTFAHVQEREVIDSVVLSGQGPDPLKVVYAPGTTHRTVTWPDGVKVEYVLNGYGSVKSRTVGSLDPETTEWREEQISPKTIKLPTSLKLEYAVNASHHLERVTVKELPPPNGADGGVPGVGVNTALVERQYTDDVSKRFGLANVSTIPGPSGANTVTTQLTPQGTLENVTVRDATHTEVYDSGSRTYDTEGKGTLQNAVDALQQTVEYLEPSAFGLPQVVKVTLPTANSTALRTLTRRLVFDRYGRVISSTDEETGAVQEWTYDSLGRLLRHKVKGEPDQEWLYTYEPANRFLKITETMPAVQHSRTIETKEETAGEHAGVTVLEKVRFGKMRADESWPEALRVTYLRNGRQESTVDALNVRREYEYDDAGRLTGVKITNAGDTTGPAAETYEVKYEDLDADGNPRRIIDHNGLVTKVGYDAFGRPVYWDYTGADGMSARETEESYRDFSGQVTSHAFGGLTLKHVLAMHPDPLGRITSTQSVGLPGGVFTNATYDAMGRITSRSDTVMGSSETFEYKDALGRLTYYSRTTQSGATTLKLEETREYHDARDTNGRRKVIIVRTIPAAGSPTRTEQLEQEIDAADRVMKETTRVHGVQASTLYVYNARGNVTSVTTPTNETTVFHYDSAGNLVKREEPGNADAPAAITEFVVDPGWRVSHTQGPRTDDVWEFQYDAFGQLTSRKLLTTSTNTLGATWTHEYGVKAAKGFDGTVPDSAEVETDPLNRKTYRFFNARHQLLKEVREDKGVAPESQNTLTTVLAYDGPWLRKRVMTEATAGAQGTAWVTTLEREDIDDRGRSRKVREHWTGSVASSAHDYEYITESPWNGRTVNVVQRGTTSVSVRQQDFTLEVDSLGNLIRRTQGGLTDEWSYDADGQLVMAAPAGTAEMVNTYDEGLLVRRTLGTESTEFEYRLDGQLRKATEPSGRVLELFYAPRGLVERETYGLGSEKLETKYTYDSGGFLKSVAKGHGTADRKEWAFDYGPLGELRGTTAPGQGTFAYGYDALRQLVSIRPPGSAGALEEFKYDYLGRKVSRKRGASVWETKWVQGAAERTNPDDDVVVSLPDGRGRVALEKFQPGASTQAYKDLSEVAYAYDGQDGLLRARESREGLGEVVNTYAYDGRHRLEEGNRAGDLVKYEYMSGSDQLYRRTSRRGAETGRVVEYGYDTLSRVSSLKTFNGSLLQSSRHVTFEAGGERLVRLADDGSQGQTVENRCYDGQGRLTSVRATTLAAEVGCAQSPSTAVTWFQYEYDGRGNRKSERFRGTATAMAEQLTEYGYDAADRLTGVRYPADSESRRAGVLYQLSPEGLRLGEKRVANLPPTVNLDERGFYEAVLPEVDWAYGYNATGVLQQIEHPGGLVASYTTDGSGRMTGEQIANGPETKYGWDAAGRLTHVEQPAGGGGGGAGVTQTKYRYGFDGLRRFRQVGSNSATEYLWDSSGLVEERTGTSRLLYESLGSQVVSAGGERVLHDGLGSAVGRMTAGGLVSYRYDAWGGYREGSGPGAGEPSVGYTGHGFDADTGLVYAQQRWYSPKLGRFLSADPVGPAAYLDNPTGIQPWLYANANPMRYTDPTGELFVEGGASEERFYAANRKIRESCAAGSVNDCRFMKVQLAVATAPLGGIGVEALATYAVGRAVLAGLFAIGTVSTVDNALQCSGARSGLLGVDDDNPDACFDTALDSAFLVGGFVKARGSRWLGGAFRPRQGLTGEILPPEPGFRPHLPSGPRARRPSEEILDFVETAPGVWGPAPIRPLLASGQSPRLELPAGAPVRTGPLVTPPPVPPRAYLPAVTPETAAAEEELWFRTFLPVWLKWRAVDAKIPKAALPSKKAVFEGAQNDLQGPVFVDRSHNPPADAWRLPAVNRENAPPGACAMPHAAQRCLQMSVAPNTIHTTRGGFGYWKDNIDQAKTGFFFKSTCRNCGEIYALNPTLRPTATLPPGVSDTLGPNVHEKFTVPQHWEARLEAIFQATLASGKVPP